MDDLAVFIQLAVHEHRMLAAVVDGEHGARERRVALRLQLARLVVALGNLDAATDDLVANRVVRIRQIDDHAVFLNGESALYNAVARVPGRRGPLYDFVIAVREQVVDRSCRAVFARCQCADDRIFGVRFAAHHHRAVIAVVNVEHRARERCVALRRV